MRRVPRPSSPSSPSASPLPQPSFRSLDGVRVLELGQLLAGPFASVLLAWFGADVIKVEPPDGGDPLRTWRQMHHGTSLWWYSLARNKRCVTADLRSRRRPRPRQAAGGEERRGDRELPSRAHGGLGPRVRRPQGHQPRHRHGPCLGLRPDRPYAPKPGYASVAEGYGGLRYVTGFPDRPPARANLSLGDSIAGLHAALGILTALYHRDAKGTGEGQVVDVAIYESILNLMESVVPGVRHLRPRPRAARVEGHRHRSQQLVRLCRRQVHHHRRQRRQHLQAADGGGRADPISPTTRVSRAMTAVYATRRRSILPSLRGPAACRSTRCSPRSMPLACRPARSILLRIR